MPKIDNLEILLKTFRIREDLILKERINVHLIL